MNPDSSQALEVERSLSDASMKSRPFRAEVIAVILALVVQGAGIVWWGSNINARVSALEVKAVASAHSAEDVARIDERTSSIKEALVRIESRLDETRKP